MKPPRTWPAPFMIVILLWTMVVAPFAVARCLHDSGVSHLHALGSDCHAAARTEHPAHAGCSGHDAPSVECHAYEGSPAAPADNLALRTPPPADFTPAFVEFVVALAECAGPGPQAPERAPPRHPPRETHGAGCLPLLI